MKEETQKNQQFGSLNFSDVMWKPRIIKNKTTLNHKQLKNALYKIKIITSNFAHFGILQFDMNTGCYCHLQIKPW